MFATIPAAAYVVPGLLVEAGVEPVLAVAGLPEDVMQGLVNSAIAADAGSAYLAVRTDEGLTLLRERAKSEA